MDEIYTALCGHNHMALMTRVVSLEHAMTVQIEKRAVDRRARNLPEKKTWLQKRYESSLAVHMRSIALC